MRIKAKSKNGITIVKVMMKHPMISYKEAKKKGKEANFYNLCNCKSWKWTPSFKMVSHQSPSFLIQKNPNNNGNSKVSKGWKPKRLKRFEINLGLI